MEKPTTLPWREGLGSTILDTKGKVLGLTAGSSSIYSIEKRIAERDFIIRACNSHDALLAACKSALTRLQSIYNNCHVDSANEISILISAISQAEKGE